MGNCNFKTEKTGESTEVTTTMTKNMFLQHFIIGKGGFGKVWRVEFKKTKEIYAMKIMSKFKVYQKKSITSVMNEKKLLENLRHP
jgi:serine/threonine protein kinase